MVFLLTSNAHATSTAIPQHNTRVEYEFDGLNSLAYNYDYFIKFNGQNSVRSGLGLYAQFAFGFQAGPIGYLGLQKEFDRTKAIFSIWDADESRMTALPTGNDACVRFSHEGPGTMCIISYNWVTDREYRLRLWSLGNNVQGTGQTWWVGVKDMVTGVESTVGSILLLNSNGYEGYGFLEAKNGWPLTVNEYYGAGGQTFQCSDLPMFDATRRGPFANNNDYSGVRTLPIKALVSYHGYGIGTDCPNNNVSSIEPHSLTVTTGANTQRVTPDGVDVWSKLSQTIAFNPVASIQVGESRAMSAQASSGLAVSFSVTPSNGVCSLSGAVVTGISQGVCTVYADQAGNSAYAPAPQVTVAFSVLRVNVTNPTPPTITAVIAGPGRATIYFTPPTNNGGAPIASYTASCTAAGQTTRTATGAGSPITVSGLTGGASYSCSLTASNGTYSSTSSASTAVTAGKSADITPILMLLLD